jgi:hypothetical protein
VICVPPRWAAADKLRAASGIRREQAIANGEIFTDRQVIGAPPLTVVQGGAHANPAPATR